MKVSLNDNGTVLVAAAESGDFDQESRRSTILPSGAFSLAGRKANSSHSAHESTVDRDEIPLGILAVLWMCQSRAHATRSAAETATAQ